VISDFVNKEICKDEERNETGDTETILHIWGRAQPDSCWSVRLLSGRIPRHREI